MSSVSTLAAKARQVKQPDSKNTGFRLFDNPKQLLTIREVAEALGVSVDTVRKWVYRKELRAQRLRKRDLRFVAADVEALLTPAYPSAGKMPNC